MYAGCNRHHSVEQQLCRWLLLTLDRLPSQELIMTQELVATMLGDVRELRHERRRLQAELDVPAVPAPLLVRLRDRMHRVFTRRTA